jgi:two-component system phosphate regulon sensor histidine kinase PhoR
LDALKSEFVATVSHDLRSPLTLMRGYATMLEMVGDLNEQQNNYVHKIIAAVENMSRLVNNLLDLGRIEAGVDLQLEMVLVHDVVERVTGSLQLQASQKKIQLSVDIPNDTTPLLEADQALLQQALYNLVENAIKYTEPGGKVDVRVKTRLEGIVFEVSDSGIGIAPVDLPHLFEKFFRGAQREAKKQHGTGLGLAIVKSIAERHGGRVWVESQLGKGSTFSLLIPLRRLKPEGKNIKQ